MTTCTRLVGQPGEPCRPLIVRRDFDPAANALYLDIRAFLGDS